MTDFTIPAPKVAAEPINTSRGSKKDNPPNIFVTNGWLVKDGQTREIVVPGRFVTRPAQRGKNVGQPIEVLTGDAATAVTLIRQGADELKLGVMVRTDVLTDKTDRPTGKIKVTYLVKDRKAPRGQRKA